MSKKQVLGRGLGAYFGDIKQDADGAQDSAEQQSVTSNVDSGNRVNVTMSLPVASIRANPNQPRTEFDEFKLQELSDSIRQHGLIQPITVRHVGQNRFELISGERRLRATKMAGLDSIPAYIREADDTNSIAFALIENIQREQLNPIEEAMGYQRLMDECSYTQLQVADQVGKSRPHVANMLRLLKLPAPIQAALRDQKISAGHARALVTIEDTRLQERLLEKAIEEDYSVRQIEDAVRNLEHKKTAPRRVLTDKTKDDIFLDDIAKVLRGKLSTKVELKKKSTGGEIRIEYYSNEDLDRLLNLFDGIH